MSIGTVRLTRCFNNPISKYICYVYQGKQGDVREVNIDNIDSSFTVMSKGEIIKTSLNDGTKIKHDSIIEYSNPGSYRYMIISEESHVICITSLIDDNTISITSDSYVEDQYVHDISDHYCLFVGTGTVNSIPINNLLLLDMNDIKTVNIVGSIRMITFN